MEAVVEIFMVLCFVALCSLVAGPCFGIGFIAVNESVIKYAANKGAEVEHDYLLALIKDADSMTEEEFRKKYDMPYAKEESADEDSRNA